MREDKACNIVEERRKKTDENNEENKTKESGTAEQANTAP